MAIKGPGENVSRKGECFVYSFGNIPSFHSVERQIIALYVLILTSHAAIFVFCLVAIGHNVLLPRHLHIPRYFHFHFLLFLDWNLGRVQMIPNILAQHGKGIHNAPMGIKFIYKICSTTSFAGPLFTLITFFQFFVEKSSKRDLGMKVSNK